MANLQIALLVIGCVVVLSYLEILVDKFFNRGRDGGITPRLDKLANEIFDEYRREHPEIVEAHRRISERRK